MLMSSKRKLHVSKEKGFIPHGNNARSENTRAFIRGFNLYHIGLFDKNEAFEIAIKNISNLIFGSAFK